MCRILSFFSWKIKIYYLDLSQKLSSASSNEQISIDYPRNKVKSLDFEVVPKRREKSGIRETLCLFFFSRGCVNKTWDAKPVSIEMEHRYQRWSPCEAPAGSYWNQPPILLDHCPPFHPSTKNLNHFQPLYRCFLRALTTPGFLRGHTLASQAPPTLKGLAFIESSFARVNRVNLFFSSSSSCNSFFIRFFWQSNFHLICIFENGRKDGSKI